MNPINENEFIISFKEKRKQYIILTIFMVIVGIGLGFLRGCVCSATMLIFLPIILCFVYAYYSIWRCPKCDRTLGREFNPRYCHNCGVKLSEH